MRLLLTFLVPLIFLSCAQPDTLYDGKDESKVLKNEIKTISDEYLKISARYDMQFEHNMSVRFVKINSKSIIGTCNYDQNERHIELDKEYWKNASWDTKVALLFHELTHCFCGRTHDYGNGELYKDGAFSNIIDKLFSSQPITPLKPPGFMDDSCPLSIMHPVILSDDCFEKHYEYYTKEMFYRCQPW